MSASLTRSDGVTLITLTSDPSSACPPLCQLLGALCYTPRFCSCSRHVALPRRGSQAVLGALWMVSGLLQIGLGSVLLTTRGAASYQLLDTYCPVWLGLLFVGIGVSSVLTEKYSSPCFLLLSAILNLLGSAMSITAIVWYTTQFTVRFYSLCWEDDDYYWRPSTTKTPSPQKSVLLERCVEAQWLLRVLVYSISAVLVTLSALGLCLGISSAMLSFKAFKPAKGQQGCKPLLEDDGSEASQEGA